MSRVDNPLTALTVELPEREETKWDREYRAFLRLHPQLLQSHRNKYVAIHEGQVVDSDDALVPLARRVYARHGYVPIYMDLVSDEPKRVERLPSPRLIVQEPSR